MTQAITLKFLPCTNTKPDRWKATCAAGSVTVNQHDIFNDDELRKAVTLDCNVVSPKVHAVWALLKKLEWGGLWHFGSLHTGEYVVVCGTSTSKAAGLFIEDK